MKPETGQNFSESWKPVFVMKLENLCPLHIKIALIQNIQINSGKLFPPFNILF